MLTYIVALKTIKVKHLSGYPYYDPLYGDTPDIWIERTEVNRRTRREAKVWERVRGQNHPNILPLYGIYYEENQEEVPEEQRKLYLVSPVAKGGDLSKFLGYDLESPNRVKYARK